MHTFEGYVDEATYSDFLVGSDIALQLRTHGLGSVSGALMDCITSGLPAVANMDLAEALEAPDFVTRTADALSPILIAESLAACAERLMGRPRPMEERRVFLAERNFDRYNERLLEALGLSS